MKQFDDMINDYAASGMDPVKVLAWYERALPSGETISALAESIGAEFLSERISFQEANGLLNQLMPLIGFEAAPKRFWQYYIAFEDSETSTDPDTHARAAVGALTITRAV